MPLSLKLSTFTEADDVDLVLPTDITLNASRYVEPIGYWYHRATALNISIDSGFYFGTKKEEVKSEKSEEGEGRTFSRIGADKKFVKLSEQDIETDWYGLLKLPSAEGSSENEIRAAYRRRCLETHPDKQPNRSDEEFKRVQRAFEILSDPTARRTYDSSRPFDDSIPEEDLNMDERTFFTVYTPVFDRNRKWSTDTRIPKLGDANTPIKEVTRFYDAWYRFSSWRDFSHDPDLETIDDNMCREEKRYYQRENQRIIERHIRAEQKRVRTFVERAQKVDPRIRKVREAEAVAREKEKAERLAEKERIRNEEVQRKLALAEKEKAEKQAEIDKAAALKGRIKQCELDMLGFFKTNGLLEEIDTNLIKKDLVRPPNVAWLYSKVSAPEEAEELLNMVAKESAQPTDDGSVPAVNVFNELISAREQSIGMTRYGESIKRVTAEEMLARKKAEDEKRAAQRKIAASGTIWTDDDLSVLQKAIAKYPGGTVDRWRKMAQMLHDKFTEDEVLAKTKDLESQLRNGVQGQHVLTSSVAPSASAAGAPVEDEWSPDQQKQLESGLRELKDYKEKDKFQKVAKFVTGKTAKQCFDRFKLLCSLSKKK